MAVPGSAEEIGALLAALQNRCAQLEIALAGKKDGNKWGMTSRKAYNAIPHYTGKAEEYDTWKFKMTAFLHEETSFQILLSWIEEKTTEITLEELEDFELNNDKINSGETAWMNSQLYQVLSLNTLDAALAQVKNLATNTATRGVNAW